ncbi:MAG TPA: hypothetical protein VI750_08415, partial [Pyrinomonadaceae bacterium]|nr:hypothetical protein [Pyrinomonadaceae bacterium]
MAIRELIYAIALFVGQNDARQRSLKDTVNTTPAQWANLNAAITLTDHVLHLIWELRQLISLASQN